ISRRREFAMIQSIGMTKRQLCRMLAFEGGYYAGLTLAASYILGAVAVGVVVRAMVEGGFSTFHFTLMPLVCCTPVLVILAVLIPYLCFRNLEKQSIVERLRAE
ncbi:MAG: ABC transporter permease, partial [Lachnospiraceae bacterium]|nr:ABC transporter permease [Lachnospiraceae bacterium]